MRGVSAAAGVDVSADDFFAVVDFSDGFLVDFFADFFDDFFVAVDALLADFFVAVDDLVDFFVAVDALLLDVLVDLDFGDFAIVTSHAGRPPRPAVHRRIPGR